MGLWFLNKLTIATVKIQNTSSPNNHAARRSCCATLGIMHNDGIMNIHIHECVYLYTVNLETVIVAPAAESLACLGRGIGEDADAERVCAFILIIAQANVMAAQTFSAPP